MRLMTGSALLFLCAALASGPPAAFAESPLNAFGTLVEGEWRAGDSRHVFEWGVGQQAIRSRSYHRSDEGWALVGEGMWFWDPGEESIRGIAVAVGMPIDLFEYRSEVLGDEIVHGLVAHGPAGGAYVERWVFADGEYRWAVEAEKDGKSERIMGGAYKRVGGKP